MLTISQHEKGKDAIMQLWDTNFRLVHSIMCEKPVTVIRSAIQLNQRIIVTANDKQLTAFQLPQMKIIQIFQPMPDKVEWTCVK